MKFLKMETSECPVILCLYLLAGEADTDVNKFMCELKYQPDANEVTNDVVFNVWIEELTQKVECGYELFLVNMLGDVVEAPAYCEHFLTTLH